MPIYYNKAILHDEAPRLHISDLKKGKIFREDKTCSAVAKFGNNSLEVNVDFNKTNL